MLEMVKSKRDGNAMLAARNSSVYQGCYYVAYTFRSIDLFLQYVFFFCVCVLSLALLCFGHFQAKSSQVLSGLSGRVNTALSIVFTAERVKGSLHLTERPQNTS